jgi:Ca2+-transporting ATPase
MAESALRVLAFARIDEGFEHRDLTFENLPKKAIFLGLIGQMDPPRSEVAQAVKETEAAGIKTVMITGDHQATGAAIASMLGIKGNQDEVIDGPSLQLMSDRALRERIERIRVFARVLPAQKLRIIEAFQHRGHIVAMTGDGVNDAPALVKADVGVSMGITGTEVAKEAAKIVISDDNFATLVAAVGEGRLVHQNIKKLLLFLFVTSLDEVAILFLALLFGYPVPLAAVQILWINLVTEGTLTLNLIMEPAEGNEMRRPPVPKDEALLDPALLRRIPLMVLSSVGSTFGWMIYRTHEGAPLDLVRTETFTMLAVCQWFNVLNCRSAIQSAISSDLLKNPWLIGGLVLGNLLHLAVIYWPPLQGLFHTVPIEGSMFLAIIGVASWVLWVEEIRKLRIRRTTCLIP